MRNLSVWHPLFCGLRATLTPIHSVLSGTSLRLQQRCRARRTEIGRSQPVTHVIAGLSLALTTCGPVLAASSEQVVTESPAEPVATDQPPDRTVHIKMELMWFTPDTVTVTAGETIRFVVHNTTHNKAHEFTIGSAEAQEKRRDQLATLVGTTTLAAADHGSSPYDAPNSIIVPPGETRELTWTFADSDQLEFGCNIAGHYEFGMKGVFHVHPKDGDEHDLPVVSEAPAPSTTTSHDADDETDTSAAGTETAVETTASVGDPGANAIVAESSPSEQQTEPPREDNPVLAAVPTDTEVQSQSSASEQQTDPPREDNPVLAAVPSDTEVPSQSSGENAGEGNALQPQDPAQRLAAGHTLLAAGNVAEAREAFTASFDAGQHEAALALARSFDPRVIARLDVANAEPDLDEARKWYEEWHRGAVAQGTISADITLERVLRSLPDS